MEEATALIAEDEPLLAQALQAELARLWPGLRIVASVADGALALRQALSLRPDICFLDIRMPELDGLEVAQALAEEWPETLEFPRLVFVTAYDQYALRAFEHQACDYLVKPVDAERLAQCVQRLRRAIAPREAPTGTTEAVEPLRELLASLRAAAPAAPRLEVIQASIGEVVHLVPIEDVVYFEAADKYVRVVTAERELLIRTALRELLPRLDPQRFWQIHRGTVVQARRIASAHRQESGKLVLALRDRPEKLVVSRLYAHLFRGM